MSKVTVKNMTPNVSIEAARIEGVVNAYVLGARGAKEAGASWLTMVGISLEGVKAVTEAAWKASWAEPAKKGLLASGVTEASVSVTLSRLKMVTLGLTNAIAPQEGETFQTYATRASEALKEAGIVAGTGAGAPKAGSAPIKPREYVLEAFEDDADGRKEARAFMDQAGGTDRAMALLIVCEDDAALARTLGVIMAEHVAEFTQFATTLLAAPKGSRRTSRRT